MHNVTNLPKDALKLIALFLGQDSVPCEASNMIMTRSPNAYMLSAYFNFRKLFMEIGYLNRTCCHRYASMVFNNMHRDFGGDGMRFDSFTFDEFLMGQHIYSRHRVTFNGLKTFVDLFHDKEFTLSSEVEHFGANPRIESEIVFQNI